MLGNNMEGMFSNVFSDNISIAFTCDDLQLCSTFKVHAFLTLTKTSYLSFLIVFVY